MSPSPHLLPYYCCCCCYYIHIHTHRALSFSLPLSYIFSPFTRTHTNTHMHTLTLTLSHTYTYTHIQQQPKSNAIERDAILGVHPGVRYDVGGGHVPACREIAAAAASAAKTNPQGTLQLLIFLCRVFGHYTPWCSALDGQ